MSANSLVLHQLQIIVKYKLCWTGSVHNPVWEALRCSTAAPSYFPPFQIGEHLNEPREFAVVTPLRVGDAGTALHEDGGLIANNPSAIALHEARRIWQGAPLECLVSVGTGRIGALRFARVSDVELASWQMRE